MKTWSVGRLAKRVGLSRTTLLYYDRIGLLSPSARSAANYRLYNERDVQRLDAICRYREIGLPLARIADLLERSTKAGAAGVLEERLGALDVEIQRLRDQQRVIVRLLEKPSTLRRSRALDKDRWVAILRRAGLDDDAMHRWHVTFERDAPAGHQAFLESLGLPALEVQRIRRSSRLTRRHTKE